MDIVKLSTVNLYWCWEELYHHWIFSRSMTQNRFQIIMKFLHFNDNHGYDPNGENRDRLNKVWLLLEMIQERMRKVYTPGQHLSIDKLLVLYKGCRQFKQYIKNKSTRFGIELYELCISYWITLDRTVYCGKGMFTDNNPHSNMVTTERICVMLMQPFLHKGRLLYIDNFYISPTLAKYFLQSQTQSLLNCTSKSQTFF